MQALESALAQTKYKYQLETERTLMTVAEMESRLLKNETDED